MLGSRDWSCLGTSLTALDVSNNGIDGPLPSASFSALPLIERLHLQGNSFTGPMVRVSEHMPNLKDLYCSGNRLTGTLATLAGAPCLEYAWAADNELTGPVAAILPLPVCVSLRLRNNKIEGSLSDLVLDRSAKARAAVAEAKAAAAKAAATTAATTAEGAKITNDNGGNAVPLMDHSSRLVPYHPPVASPEEAERERGTPELHPRGGTSKKRRVSRTRARGARRAPWARAPRRRARARRARRRGSS